MTDFNFFDGLTARDIGRMTLAEWGVARKHLGIPEYDSSWMDNALDALSAPKKSWWRF